MSGAQLDRGNIYQLLKRHHRPLSARRLMILAQEEFGFDGNYGQFLSTLKAWAKEIPNQTAIKVHESPSMLLHDELIEVRSGVFALHPKQDHSESVQLIKKVPTQPLGHQQKSQLKEQFKLLTAHDGKSSKKGELTQESLTEADRISGFLYPYPVAPVLISDIIKAEEVLGERFNQALWFQLQDESQKIAQTLSLKLKLPPAQPFVNDSVDDSADDSADDSVDDSEYDSADDSVDDSEDDSADESVDDSEDESVDDSADESVDDSADESVDDSVDDLDRQIQSILQQSSTWTFQSQLLEQLKHHSIFNDLSQTQSLQRLNQHLKSKNHQAEALGQRPPYLFSINAEVMCSAQGQTKKLLELEAQIKQQQSDYHQELLNHLEFKLQNMSLESFESLLMAYLERDQYSQLEALNRRKDGRLALLAQHIQDTALIIAQQSNKPLSQQQLEQISRSLKSMYIDSCLVIHLGGFEQPKLIPKNFTLINAQQFAALLIEKNIGVRTYTLSRAFVDLAWFDDHKN